MVCIFFFPSRKKIIERSEVLLAPRTDVHGVIAVGVLLAAQAASGTLDPLVAFGTIGCASAVAETGTLPGVVVLTEKIGRVAHTRVSVEAHGRRVGGQRCALGGVQLRGHGVRGVLFTVVMSVVRVLVVPAGTGTPRDKEENAKGEEGQKDKGGTVFDRHIRRVRGKFRNEVAIWDTG